MNYVFTLRNDAC